MSQSTSLMKSAKVVPIDRSTERSFPIAGMNSFYSNEECSHDAPLGRERCCIPRCPASYMLLDSFVLRFRKSSLADLVAKLGISATFNRATVEGAS